MSKQTVVKILREEGVSIRRQPLSESQRAEAARRYVAGESIQQVADRIGGEYETVRQGLLEQGVVMRPATGG